MTRIICANRLPYATIPEGMSDDIAVRLVAEKLFVEAKAEFRSGCRVLHKDEVIKQPEGMARYFAQDAVLTIVRVEPLQLS